ncbi:hypothetical protein JL721_8770 [Aureococcus anophagefferens]|nr:hypothetical protein JL721_8770 [Aureococcus anophagefferens]
MGKGAGPLFDGSQIDEDGHLAAIDEDAPLGFPSIASGENERSNKDDDASPVFKLMCARRVPVGIVIPTDEYQARSNAFERAEDEADFTRAGGKCARQDNANPIALTVLKGSFEDETKGNALTKKGLDTLRERERQITEAEGWGDRYSPVFLFDKYGDPDFEDVPGTVATILASTDAASFRDMLHKDFTASNLESKILATAAYAGTPRKAVSHYVDAETEAAILGGAHIAYYDDSAKEKEEDHLHAWVRRELLDDLVKDFADSSYPTTYSFVGDEAVSDQRLAHVWHHAAGAMMVTSLTTILSFLSNLSSDFVGVVTFGVFAALLVFVNYCAVTTFMPSVVLVYESHVSKIAYPFGAARARLWAARPACLKPKDDAPKEHGHFFKVSFAPFIFKHKKKLVALHVALFGVAVAFASMLEPTPFKSYTLLPEDSNFYQLNAINEEWKPLSANPLMVHVVFGLQHRDPLSWDGPDFRFVGMASGDAKWDASFDVDSVAAQEQLLNVAEELAYAPRRGLKIDPAYGINAQLAGSSTGSLADTPDAGAFAGVQAAYGVQSLLHALRDFEDVSTAQGGGSYAAEGGVSACEPCFPTFDLSSAPARPVDRKWWEDYFYLLGRSDGTFERPALYDVQVQTTLRASEGDYAVGLRMAKKWDDWMDDHNSDPKHPLRAMVYVPGANMWVISKMLVLSGISNMLLSLFLAWLVLTYSTGNYVTSSIATATIGMIATFVLGFLQIVGWGLGPRSHAPTREGKVTDALVHTGSSVLSGAISTIGASIPMFFAKIIFFYKFGIFILLTIALSLNFSLVFFSAVLAWVGPLGKTGEVAMLYASSVKRAQATIDEIEEAQQLVDDAKAAAAARAAATETFDPDLEDDAKPVKRRKAKTSLIGPDGDVDELQY